MTLQRKLNAYIVLCAAIAVSAYSIADRLIWLVPLAAPLLLVAYRNGRSSAPWRLPPFWIRTLVLVSIGAIFLRTIGKVGPEIVSDLSLFLIVIGVIKLFDRGEARDDAQCLALSAFIVLGAMLTGSSLGVGLALAAFVPLSIASTQLLLMRHASDGPAHRLGTPPSSSLSLQDPVRASLRAKTAGATLALFAGAIAVFVGAPRDAVNQLANSINGTSSSPQTGFSQDVNLGRSGFLSDDPTPIAYMQVRDLQGHDIGSPSALWYLRGVAKDVYAGKGAWNTSPSPDKDDPFRPSGLPSNPLKFDPDTPIDLGRASAIGGLATLGAIEQRVTLLRTRSRRATPLFSSWRPVSITGQKNSKLVAPLNNVTLQRVGPKGSFTYTVTSAPNFVDSNPIQATIDRSEIPERVQTLALMLLQENAIGTTPGARSPAENRSAASLFNGYLSNEYLYTREMIAPGPGEDPIEMFLFRTKRGHCEYFASALVALCQSVDIPARVVTGYVASEFDSSSREYTVRESNAHAWAEVQIAPGRWSRFDPSPRAAVDTQPGHRGAFAWFWKAYEKLELRWSQSVVAFDGASRDRLLNFSRDQSSSDDQDAPWKSVRTIGAYAFGFGVLSIITTRAMRRRRSAEDLLADAPAARRRQVQFYAIAWEALSKQGFTRRRGVPASLEIERLRTERPQAASWLNELTTIYYRAVYGSKPLSDADQARALKLARECPREMARSRT